jgi:hypothetical protein
MTSFGLSLVSPSQPRPVFLLHVFWLMSQLNYGANPTEPDNIKNVKGIYGVEIVYKELRPEYG